LRRAHVHHHHVRLDAGGCRRDARRTAGPRVGQDLQLRGEVLSQAVLQGRPPGRRDHDRAAQGPQEIDRDHAVAPEDRAAEGGAARPGQPERLSNQYRFLTHWRLKAGIDEVSDILDDPLGLARWWPSVYVGVRELEPGDPLTHVGRYIELYTKGWLPYTLRWRFRVTESRAP